MPNIPIIVTTPAAQKNDGALDMVFKGLLVVGAVYFGNKVYKEWRANRASDKVGDPNVQAATEIHQAIDGAGTSEQTLFTIANRQLNWAEVSRAYRKLFNAQMLDDIKNDLSAADYQKFMNIYNGSSKPITITQGSWVYVEKAVNVRRTPKVTGTVDQFKNFGKTNIIGVAPSGKYIGVATGRTSRDIDTSESTLFYEVKLGLVNPDNNKSELVNAWVAASQVRLETKPAGQKMTSSTLTTFTTKNYNSALGSIGANSNYQAELRTNMPLTAIYDTNGKLIAYANNKGVVLGSKEAEFNRDGMHYYIFKNIQGLTRMALVDQVKEVKI